MNVLSENVFKFLSQDFFGEKLELVKRKGFSAQEYSGSFEKFKEGFPEKIKFCRSLSNSCINDEDYEHVVENIGNEKDERIL